MGRKKKSDVISSNPAEILKYKKWAKELPDVQQDRVDEIKRKIESGEYQVDAEAVAKKILELSQDIKKANCPSKTRK